MGKNYAKKFAIGALVAAAAGYVAGILTAPKSGKETRQDIKDKAGEAYATAEKELKKLHAELDKMLKQAEDVAKKLKGKSGEQLSDAISKGQKAKEKARELLGGVHDGEADDKDLQQAIKDATKAIEHLREFLTK